MSAADSKRYKQALRDSLKELRQPHPLEVLGVTQEIARMLDPDALVIAARGLARARQMSLHPDRSTGRKADATEKLNQISAAREAIERDPSQARQSYLNAQRRKRKAPPSKERAKEILDSRNARKSEAVRDNAGALLVEGLYAPEAITRLKSARILLRPVSIFPKQDSDMPLNSIVAEEGRAVVGQVRFLDSVTPGQHPILHVVDQKLDMRDCQRYGFYVNPDTVEVISDDRMPFTREGQIEGLEPGWWYEMRGKSPGSRSMQLYAPVTREEKNSVSLLGCIPQRTAIRLQEWSLPGETENARAELQSVKAGSVAIPDKFRHHFNVRPDNWQTLITGNMADTQDVLTPSLVKSQILLAEQEDGSKVMLGRVEHFSATYY